MIDETAVARAARPQRAPDRPRRPAGLLAWLLAGLLLATSLVHAQSADDRYHVDADSLVRTLAVQPDGKLIVGGNFAQIGGQPRTHLARLLVDGSVDADFAATMIDGNVHAVAVQPNGHLVIGGSFNQVGACACKNIARLKPDGSVDGTMFLPGGADAAVFGLMVQPGGSKVLVGGDFGQIGGVTRPRIARLNADGSLDPDFDAGAVDGLVRALVAQADGKVVIGGTLTSVGGIARNNLARLNANGALDTGFDPPGGVDGAVVALATQVDNKLLVGGLFTQIGGVARNSLARLNADGSVDNGFNPAGGANNAVWALSLQADGKVLLGGNFTSVGGLPRNRLARLNPDGSVDAGFDPIGGADDLVLALATQADGKVVVGGNFIVIGGAVRKRFARLHADGSVEVTFYAGPSNGEMYAAAVQPDGKVLVGGRFTQIGVQTRNRIARLHADGMLDSGFNPNVDGVVDSLALQSDGKVLVGGDFTQIGGMTRNRIARLNANGTVDAGFNPPGGVEGLGSVLMLVVQPDGKVIVGGSFIQIGGVAREYLARLHADGRVDSGFNAGAIGSPIFAGALQDDGKLLVGGMLGKIARLNPDGTLDPTFDVGTGANQRVYAIAVAPDGKVLVGGRFTEINGVAANHIARLNPDGSVDRLFHGNANDAVYVLAAQADGKILIGGDFSKVVASTQFGGIYATRNRVARLNPDGLLDAWFDPAGGVNGTVSAVTLQVDGKPLVAGAFSQIAGMGHDHIARLSSREAALQSLTFEDGAVLWRRSGTNPELAAPPALSFSVSGNPATFVTLGAMQRIDGGWRYSGFAPPPGQSYSLRAQGRASSGGRSSGLIETTARLFGDDRIFRDGFDP